MEKHNPLRQLTLTDKTAAFMCLESSPWMRSVQLGSQRI